MKKKPPQKASSETGSPATKKAAKMSLLLKISFILCVISTLCLFVSIADLKVINLMPVLAKYSAAFLGMQLLTSVLCAFAFSQASSANREIAQQHSEGLNEKIESRIEAVEDKVQEYLGENYQRLKEQNETMKTEFEQIRETASNKIIAEIEELKIENADLRKKLDNKNGTPDQEEALEQENQLQVA